MWLVTSVSKDYAASIFRVHFNPKDGERQHGPLKCWYLGTAIQKIMNSFFLSVCNRIHLSKIVIFNDTMSN
jgi:hypothetical protein